MNEDNGIGRRTFMKRAAVAALCGTAPCLAHGEQPRQSEAVRKLTIETDGPARLEVRGSREKMFQPERALMDRTARVGAGKGQYYLGHFTSTGTAVLHLPVGRYTIIAEKGLEFHRLEKVVELNVDRSVRLTPGRWVSMASKGWWSGDLHVHRPPTDAKILLAAEDLNLGVFFTIWNSENYWEGKKIPEDPVERLDATHVATLMNAEDERGGGAWMMHNLKVPLDLSAKGRWYPQGNAFVERAKDQGAWFECEKPIWWEAPVMAAITSIDSLGVLHNHYNQYGMVADEAWGRPRDRDLYPGDEGFSDYSLSLYYRYLNLGMRLPASAGSASGVLLSPPGYNRVYAYAPDGFSVESFYSALRAGRNFVTNGPMLAFSVNGKMPGDTLQISSDAHLEVAAEALARDPIDRIEILANGEVVADTAGSKLEKVIKPANHTWLAARCFLKRGLTIRLAHSSPIYLAGKRQTWDSSRDRAYFAKWIDDLVSESEEDSKRFQSEERKEEIHRIYWTARSFYTS